MRNIVIIALIFLTIGVLLNINTSEILQTQESSNSKLEEFEQINKNFDNNAISKKKDDTNSFTSKDFSSYMRSLQRSIKPNWEPPTNKENKTIVLLKIAKDGSLLARKIHTSSGVTNADNAAIKAVDLSAPFEPLPADFEGQNVDILFTFDYRKLTNTKN